MTVVALNTAPNTVRPAETATIFDIATLVNACYQQNIEPTQAGRVPKRIANKLTQQLQGQERLTYNDVDEYLEMLYVIMQDMRLVQIVRPPFSDMKARIEPGTQLASWSQLNIVQQTKRLLEQWNTNHHWLDVAGVNYNPMSWSFSYYTDLKSGRNALLKHLRKYQPGQWYAIDSILQLLWEEDTLAFSPTYGYMSKAEQRRLKTNREGWMTSDGELYIGMFETSLHELGLVALGYEASSLEDLAGTNPSAFMLTDLGASVLMEERNGTDTDDPPAAERLLIVQPNFELLLLQPDLSTLYSVLPFTQVSQLGIVSSLKLTSVSLLRGLSAGKSVEQVIQALTEHSQKELPQNVVYSLYDWARQYKEVRVTQVLLLEVPGEAAANQLSASPRLQKFGVRQLGPAMLAVNGDTNIQELRNALDKEGIVARMSGNFSNRAHM